MCIQNVYKHRRIQNIEHRYTQKQMYTIPIYVYTLALPKNAHAWLPKGDYNVGYQYSDISADWPQNVKFRTHKH